MTNLLQRLATYKPFTAMVVGDFMLDQHVHGAAERLSPDAPVPVLHATKSESTPGGAANVARCLRALKGDVVCIGVTGSDVEGAALREALAREGCDTAGLVQDRERPTTVKQSLVGLAQHRHPQKMFRVDRESRDPLTPEVAQAILRAIDGAIDRCDVVCIEDYNKGVCTPAVCSALVRRCRDAGKPLLVDPAFIPDYSKYRGATTITPNRSEAELATNLDTPIDATDEHNARMAATLLRSLDLASVVLTLDRHGAMLALPGEPPRSIPTVARSVYDVTGAGDMVLAALAGAIANGFPWDDAVRFANAAAGLEVEVFGAQPIPFAAVRRSILRMDRQLDGKVRDLDDLLVELEVHRHDGERIVLTNGCFDVIHAGHVGYLRAARALGDVLVVAVNADGQVRALKGDGRPVYRQSERLEVLSELACVDYLVVFGERTAHGVIEAIRPHVYVKGGDYAPEDVAEFDLLKRLMDEGALEFRTVAHRPGLGSTQVIERFVRAYGGSVTPTT
jgi:D-beta-D-heptose 7-phosphate kinase/D-beta-D-heptose 1-phosphate adenosyltransferase